jgi:hypothetical protein
MVSMKTLFCEEAFQNPFHIKRDQKILVHFFVVSKKFQIKRDQKIPLIWFVANVGGILGLTMGCSLVTIFEILHHVLIWSEDF